MHGKTRSKAKTSQTIRPTIESVINLVRVSPDNRLGGT